MHSNIIQISKKPFVRDPRGEDRWAVPEDFYDNSEDFADWIGDEYDEEERESAIKNIVACFGGVFEADGETLIYKGLGNFISDWYSYIKELAGELEGNKYDTMKLFRIKLATQHTHNDIWTRFYIEDWNGYATPTEDFIGFLQSQCEIGDRLYIGAIIDYHF